jgi:heme/copper-type cytochrome/quinol oxidase subunit 4
VLDIKESTLYLLHVKQAWHHDKETGHMKRVDALDSSSIPQHDQRNQRRIVLWSLAWALSFVAVALVIKNEWLPFGLTIALVIGTAIVGVATVLAYHRFLAETDELRRKIEVEALAFAFGVGFVGGHSYWLLVVKGAAPATGFIYVFAAMVLTYAAGVVMGLRKYS